MDETYETSGPRCPYCKHLHEPEDGYWHDEMLTEAECAACEQVFDVYVHRHTSWTCTGKGAEEP